MLKRKPIINLPLLIGSVLSIAIHVGALYGKGVYTPPKPLAEPGRTVVRLTLLPSVARPAAASELPATDRAEQPHVEQAVPEPSVPVAEASKKPGSVTVSANTPEREASLIQDKGVITEAEPSRSVIPVYPRISQRRGEEGTVTLSIEVFSDGSVGRVALVHSSGYPRLDQAAIKAARMTAFIPAIQMGHHIDSTTKLSFTFRLTDD